MKEGDLFCTVEYMDFYKAEYKLHSEDERYINQAQLIFRDFPSVNKVQYDFIGIFELYSEDDEEFIDDGIYLEIYKDGGIYIKLYEKYTNVIYTIVVE